MMRAPTLHEQLGLFVVGLVVGDLLGRLLTWLDRPRPSVKADPGWTFYVGDREVAVNEMDEMRRRRRYGAENPQSN